MPTTRETIRAFYAHIERKEFEALRGLLHDDLHFQGLGRSAKRTHLCSKKETHLKDGSDR